MKKLTTFTNTFTLSIFLLAILSIIMRNDNFLLQNANFIFYHIIMITFCSYIYKIKKNKSVESILLLINLFSFSSIILGELFNFYEYFSFYDKLLHTFSGFIITYFTYHFFEGVIDKKLQLLFSFNFAMASASLWELFEYTCDQIFGSNMQESFFYKDFKHELITSNLNNFQRYNDSALSDTMTDMSVAFIGALIFILLHYFKKNSI